MTDMNSTTTATTAADYVGEWSYTDDVYYGKPSRWVRCVIRGGAVSWESRYADVMGNAQ